MNDNTVRYKRRYAVYGLTHTNDPRVLNALIRATSHKWGMHPEVVKAITRLLLQVTEKHAGLLDSKVQERLWQLAIAPVNVKANPNEALACAALHAFVRIGSRETLRRLRNFTLHMTFYAANRRINDALQASIPFIEARLKRQEIPATLLRAADTPALLPDTLLRPAHLATTEPPEQLLRSGGAEQIQNP